MNENSNPSFEEIKNNLIDEAINPIDKAIKAINEGNLISMQNLLKSGLNPNSVDKNSNSLLNISILADKPDFVEALLVAGADPDATNHSKAVFKVRNGLSELADSDIKIKLTPLMSAINKNSSNCSKIISSLLQHNAKVDIAEQRYSLTALHFAANNINLDVIKILLANGANPNHMAFRNNRPITFDSTISNITPLLLATDAKNYNEKKYSKSSDCVKTLIDKGADPLLNSNILYHFTSILDTLSYKYPQDSAKVLDSYISRDYNKMDYSNFLKTINEFFNDNIQESSKMSSGLYPKISSYVEKILNPDVDFKTLYGNNKYYSHLRSWKNDIAAGYSSHHTQESAEGWLSFYQIPKKMKHMLILLNDVKITSSDDCQIKFGESKENITNKIKDELWNQTTTYFTDIHIRMINNLSDKKLANRLLNNELTKWCDIISDLEPKQSFAISAGTSNHSVYIEFKKQPDDNISRIIYNLGAGSNLHTLSDDKKTYPHVVENIPVDLFKIKNFLVMDYLNSIITAKKFPTYFNGKLVPSFENVYQKPKYIFDDINIPRKPDNYIPMKQQMVGNCSVKNNLSAIRNRFHNDSLYYYLKNLEQTILRKSINVPEKAFNRKELEKDLASIDFIVINSKPVELLEKLLFGFLIKRTTDPSLIDVNKPGERIAEALINLKDTDNFDFYVANKPALLDAIYSIAKKFKSESLHNIVRQYSLDYEFMSISDFKKTMKKVTNTENTNDLSVKRKSEGEAIGEKMLSKRQKTLDNGMDIT